MKKLTFLMYQLTSIVIPIAAVLLIVVLNTSTTLTEWIMQLASLLITIVAVYWCIIFQLRAGALYKKEEAQPGADKAHSP